MKRRALELLALVLLLTSIAAAAEAALISFEANLSGDQEVPAVVTPGFGFGTVVLDDVANEITVSLTVQDLLGVQVAAHIHGQASVGVNAGVFITLPVGNFSNVVFGVTPEQAGWLKDGLTYINVHTLPPGFPSGEIRGQLTAVPEPATLLLFGTGLVGVGVVTRRRWKQ